MDIDNSIRLPLDTTAMIGAEGLLGGEYVRLDPGGGEDMIEPGGQVEYTQAAVDLIGLLTQLVFSQKESD